MKARRRGREILRIYYRSYDQGEVFLYFSSLFFEKSNVPMPGKKPIPCKNVWKLEEEITLIKTALFLIFSQNNGPFEKYTFKHSKGGFHPISKTSS